MDSGPTRKTPALKSVSVVLAVDPPEGLCEFIEYVTALIRKSIPVKLTAEPDDDPRATAELGPRS